MRFKCGKCGTVIDTAKNEQQQLDPSYTGVVCSACKAVNKVLSSRLQQEKKIPPTEVVRPAAADQPEPVPGWIFVHDENTPMQSFDLKKGKNIIGRRSSVHADIAIETKDEYMSRRHCMVEVTVNPSGTYDFLLSDLKALNGTFLNGTARKRLKPEDMVMLNDGDTIQIGMTKVVIRIRNKAMAKDTAEQEVKNSAYAPTVLVMKK